MLPTSTPGSEGTSGSSVPGSPIPLSTPVTYDQGKLGFAPPPASYVPAVSARTAYSNWLAIWGHAPGRTAPLTQLALYTNYTHGAPNANGTLQLTYDHVPAWVFTFKDVPFAPSGGGTPPGQPHADPGTVLEDEIVVVNATDGSNIAVANDRVDPSPYPAPPEVNGAVHP